MGGGGGGGGGESHILITSGCAYCITGKIGGNYNYLADLAKKLFLKIWWISL